MRSNRTTTETAKGLLLATLLCLSMLYAQVAHARLAIGSGAGADSMVSDQVRLLSAEPAGLSDTVISAVPSVSSVAVDRDHGGGLQNGKGPVHSSMVFGLVEAVAFAAFGYAAAKIRALDVSIDGRPVAVDRRPPKS